MATIITTTTTTMRSWMPWSSTHRGLTRTSHRGSELCMHNDIGWILKGSVTVSCNTLSSSSLNSSTDSYQAHEMQTSRERMHYPVHSHGLAVDIIERRDLAEYRQFCKGRNLWILKEMQPNLEERSTRERERGQWPMWVLLTFKNG